MVKCWKSSRLLDAYFWTTSKIALKIELRYYLNCAYSRWSTVYDWSVEGEKRSVGRPTVSPINRAAKSNRSSEPTRKLSVFQSSGPSNL